MQAPIFLLLFLALTNTSAIAADAKNKRTPLPDSEPVKCYKIVWGSKESPGLGLTAGQAVTLCRGTDNGIKTATCFAQAWTHQDDGGLGLNAGQAVALCNPNAAQ